MTTTQKIRSSYPPLIGDQEQSLREKVAAVWNEAINTGCGGKGWTFDELRAVKFTLLAGDINMTFVEHLNSCARQCIAIADVLREIVPLRDSHSARSSYRRCAAGGCW